MIYLYIVFFNNLKRGLENCEDKTIENGKIYNLKNSPHNYKYIVIDDY
jgi:hypothetical protein